MLFKQIKKNLSYVRFNNRNKDRIFNTISTGHADFDENGKPIIKLRDKNDEIVTLRLGDYLLRYDNTNKNTYPVYSVMNCDSFVQKYAVKEIIKIPRAKYEVGDIVSVGSSADSKVNGYIFNVRASKYISPDNKVIICNRYDLVIQEESSCSGEKIDISDIGYLLYLEEESLSYNPDYNGKIRKYPLYFNKFHSESGMCTKLVNEKKIKDHFDYNYYKEGI